MCLGLILFFFFAFCLSVVKNERPFVMFVFWKDSEESFFKTTNVFSVM